MSGIGVFVSGIGVFVSPIQTGAEKPTRVGNVLFSEDDFDYIHHNPVKHRLGQCRRDWPWSSFPRWVEAGVYSPNWGCLRDGPLRFDDLDETAME